MDACMLVLLLLQIQISMSLTNTLVKSVATNLRFQHGGCSSSHTALYSTCSNCLGASA